MRSPSLRSIVLLQFGRSLLALIVVILVLLFGAKSETWSRFTLVLSRETPGDVCSRENRLLKTSAKSAEVARL
jgi:hypothetical protein